MATAAASAELQLHQGSLLGLAVTRHRSAPLPDSGAPRGGCGIGLEQRARVRDGAASRNSVLGRAALDDRGRRCITTTSSQTLVDHREVVADEEVGDAEAVLQVLQQVQHLGLHRDVERAHRLVGDDQRAAA